MNKSFWTVKTLKAFKGDSKELNWETGWTYVPHPRCSCSPAPTFSSSLYVSRARCDQILMKVRCLTTPRCGPETSVKGWSPCLADSPFMGSVPIPARVGLRIQWDQKKLALFKHVRSCRCNPADGCLNNQYFNKMIFCTFMLLFSIRVAKPCIRFVAQGHKNQ